MKEFNEFQNENFEKGVMVEKRPRHEIEKRPKNEIEEGPKHEVEKRPKHEIEKRPKHEAEGGLKHANKENPRNIEEKINFIINFSTDKTQLLELKKILVELEFYDKKEEEVKQKYDERKIRRR